VRLCLVVLDFEAARWQLPESIRTKHAPIVTHYQQTFNNLQTHRYGLNDFFDGYARRTLQLTSHHYHFSSLVGASF
jgi:hypothetical protein